eukprot:GHVQ01034988.1.p1 GENE.GHVQ01034988.1~~GHVQ01034988.1.p1  ORF type:complete len:365 (+),score=18.47 GHVQ01034988.1:120-1214(+)
MSWCPYVCGLIYKSLFTDSLAYNMRFGTLTEDLNKKCQRPTSNVSVVQPKKALPIGALPIEDTVVVSTAYSIACAAYSIACAVLEMKTRDWDAEIPGAFQFRVFDFDALFDDWLYTFALDLEWHRVMTNKLAKKEALIQISLGFAIMWAVPIHQATVVIPKRNKVIRVEVSTEGAVTMDANFMDSFTQNLVRFGGCAMNKLQNLLTRWDIPFDLSSTIRQYTNVLFREAVSVLLLQNVWESYERTVKTTSKEVTKRGISHVKAFEGVEKEEALQIARTYVYTKWPYSFSFFADVKDVCRRREKFVVHIGRRRENYDTTTAAKALLPSAPPVEPTHPTSPPTPPKYTDEPPTYDEATSSKSSSHL